MGIIDNRKIVHSVNGKFVYMNIVQYLYVRMKIWTKYIFTPKKKKELKILHGKKMDCSVFWPLGIKNKERIRLTNPDDFILFDIHMIYISWEQNI